jgi:hypothetical protein
MAVSAHQNTNEQHGNLAGRQSAGSLGSSRAEVSARLIMKNSNKFTLDQVARYRVQIVEDIEGQVAG